MDIFLPELIGTMLLIIFGDGVVANVVLSKTKGQNSGWIVIATGWGMAVVVGVYAVAGYTGAHINPAVTIGLLSIGKVTAGKAVLYILGQFAGAFIGGLRGVHGASIAYRYWVRETTPVYADGLTELPEPDDDFMHFMRLPRISDVVRKGMQYELTNPTVDPYDSHPPLAARIAALQRLPPGNDTSHEPLAASLLDPIAAGSAAPSADAPTTAPAAGPLPWSAVQAPDVPRRLVRKRQAVAAHDR